MIVELPDTVEEGVDTAVVRTLLPEVAVGVEEAVVGITEDDATDEEDEDADGVTPPEAGMASGISGCLPESGVVLKPPQVVAARVKVVPYILQMLTLSGPAQTRQLA